MGNKRREQAAGQARNAAPKKKKRRFTAPGILIAVIMCVVVGGFIVTLLRAQLLPGKGLAIACGVLLLVLALVVFLSADHHHKARFWWGFALSLLLTAVLLLGGLYMNRGISALKNITSSDEQVDVVEVFVLQEDEANGIGDTKGYRFGTFKCPDYGHIEETVQKIGDKLGGAIDVEVYRNLTDMIDALMDEEIDAIITRAGYLDLLDDTEGYETARSQLRSIYQVEFRDKLQGGSDKGSKKHTEPFSVYISGIDTYGDVSVRSRSDVNILATINPQTHQILLLSTPRDYYVPLSISDGIPDKLTHAGIYGVDVSMDTIGMLYGIDVDYFFRVNFSGFEEIIDSLGGVTVDSAYEFASSVSNYYYYEGPNELSGEAALFFARERYAFADGDRQRGRNQMAVIRAVIEKALSPEILKNYNSVLEAVEGNFETSVPYSMVASLVRDQLKRGGDWNVVTYSVTGTGDSQIPYSMSSYAYVMIPDEESVASAKELIRQVYDDETITLPTEE